MISHVTMNLLSNKYLIGWILNVNRSLFILTMTFHVPIFGFSFRHLPCVYLVLFIACKVQPITFCIIMCILCNNNSNMFFVCILEKLFCSYLYKETFVDYFVIIFVKKSLYILSIEIYIFYTITIDIFYS